MTNCNRSADKSSRSYYCNAHKMMYFCRSFANRKQNNNTDMKVTNYISPLCRIIQVSLNGMLMDSKLYSPASPETYDTTDDSENWN